MKWDLQGKRKRRDVSQFSQSKINYGGSRGRHFQGRFSKNQTRLGSARANIGESGGCADRKKKGHVAVEKKKKHL